MDIFGSYHLNKGAKTASSVCLLLSTCLVHADPHVAKGPAFGEWGVPIDTAVGGCPIESPNGKELYTAASSAGTLDIWVYKRKNGVVDEDTRAMLPEPISLPDAEDFCPLPLNAGWLMFVSDRVTDESCGGSDILVTKQFKGDSGAEMVVKNLGCGEDGPNTSGTELSPSLIHTKAGTFLYYSSDISGHQDIYRSRLLPDGSYSPGEPVAELNTEGDDRQPNVSKDGLTIVFASSRDTGVFDVFMSTRKSIYQEWGEPVNLSVELAFPTAALSETRPSLSRDLKRLYYGADGIIYVSEREIAK
jgi:hypothetical protein